MILLVGLGNPGKEYTATRHNVGFRVVDAFAKHYAPGEPFRFQKDFHAETLECHRHHKKILLAKPQTFMNESGKSVAALANFFHVAPSDIWIFSDDVDLPLGTVRIRDKGSSGGHRGVQSIVDHLGKETFIRFRLGIMSGTYEHSNDTRDFVLGKFSREEQKIVNEMIDGVLEAVDHALQHSLQTKTLRGLTP